MQVDAQIGCITFLLSCQESLLPFLQWEFLIFVYAAVHLIVHLAKYSIKRTSQFSARL